MVDPKIKKEFIFDIIFYITQVIFVSTLYPNNFVVTVLILLSWTVAVKYWHTRDDIYIFLSGAVLGAISEITAVHFGAWQYANPTFLGIPIWLPLLWGSAIVMVKRLGDIISEARSNN